MTFNSLQFLSDENIDIEVVEFLRDFGSDVYDIKENNLFGLSDKSILQMAFEQKRVVISQDSDFGTLIYRDKSDAYGIVYLRPGHVFPEIHIKSIQAIIDANLSFKFPFILVAENKGDVIKIRLREI